MRIEARRIRAASASTGTQLLFPKQGFEVAAERPSGKQRVRRHLTSAPRRASARRPR